MHLRSTPEAELTPTLLQVIKPDPTPAASATHNAAQSIQINPPLLSSTAVSFVLFLLETFAM